MYYQYPQGPRREQHVHQQQQRQKLKCLVLGAAGAGKTSILRRHFRKVFEQGTRVPTLGSDFYTGRMSLTAVVQNVDQESSRRRNRRRRRPRNTTTHSADGDYQDEDDPYADDVNDEDDENDDVYDEQEDEEEEEEEEEEFVSIDLQMWDTPGRERYYMEKQHRGGHHAASAASGDHHHRSVVAASLSDSFFRNVSAIMLVYDMTSSTSFTQLLRWYADLMEMKNHHLHQDSGHPETCSFPILIVGNKLDILNSKILRHNNVDLASTSGHGASAGGTMKQQRQRDVMGLKGAFRGNDFRYEYDCAALEQPTPQPLPTVPSNSSSLQQKQQQQNQSRNHATSKRNGYRRYNDNMSGNSSKTPPSVMKIYSSALFLAHRHGVHNHDNANVHNTNSYDDEQYMNMDGSYLNSLLNSEDESHPDRDLVILWCMRNGLQHMQVSAATGEGVEEAIEMLVRLALENKKQQQAAAAAAAAVQQQQQRQYIEQSAIPSSTGNVDNTSTAGITDTTESMTTSTETRALLNISANGTDQHVNRNTDMVAASSSISPSSLPSNDDNPFQIQRRYPKLDWRERYASKDDQSKCFSCFLGRIVMKLLRERCK